ncbi:hypothetical protein LDL05_14270 [Nonomuraea cavernae]|nr:hypothetical protein [Nonomuraea cavernae]MCA2186230.1 hypothetical protein [Nonomuraea cavernae]
MSKPMTFTLACVVSLSALLPGTAGYLSARLDAIRSAERSLRAVEARLDIRMAREAREGGSVSFPEHCVPPPTTVEPPATALRPEDRHHRRDHRPAQLSDWLPQLVDSLAEAR